MFSLAGDGKDDPAPTPENYGTYTFVLAHGHFALTEEDHETAQRACT